jgi:purine-cytosine permease-like protein
MEIGKKTMIIINVICSLIITSELYALTENISVYNIVPQDQMPNLINHIALEIGLILVNAGAIIFIYSRYSKNKNKSQRQTKII